MFSGLEDLGKLFPALAELTGALRELNVNVVRLCSEFSALRATGNSSPDAARGGLFSRFGQSLDKRARDFVASKVAEFQRQPPQE